MEETPATELGYRVFDMLKSVGPLGVGIAELQRERTIGKPSDDFEFAAERATTRFRVLTSISSSRCSSFETFACFTSRRWASSF